VDDQLREMRAEMQRLQQEVDELKRLLQTRADIAEEVPLIQAQIQKQAQTKVETGTKLGLARLLYGYVRLDGEKTAFEIGQDHMVLAPKNPTSLMGSAFPTLYRSGNLYLRAPQVRAERTIASGDFGQIRAVGGIMAPIAGDFGGPGSSYQFVPPNLAGERSRTPAVQSRLSWRATPAGPYEQPQWEVGVSGHYGRERYGTVVTPSWATAVD